jgi:hypothetical protein
VSASRRRPFGEHAFLPCPALGASCHFRFAGATGGLHRQGMGLGWMVARGRHCIWSGDNAAAIRGSGEEELMKKALMGASAAAVMALAPLCISSAQAHADDPCVSIIDPAAQQACIDGSLSDDPLQRARMGDCQASPDYGANGQFCRNFWVRKSAPPPVLWP